MSIENTMISKNAKCIIENEFTKLVIFSFYVQPEEWVAPKISWLRYEVGLLILTW